MDTPKFPPPQDEGEKLVLAALSEIQDQLLLRKLDRTTYVRSHDVLGLYEQTLEQVKRLNEVRNGRSIEENQGMILPCRAIISCSLTFTHHLAL